MLKNLLFKIVICGVCCILDSSCGHINPEEAVENAEPQTVVVMNKDYFPDVSFRSVICRILPIAEGDTIPNDYLLKIEELRLSALGICSLKGIEYFPALEQVDCSHNMLKEIDVSKNLVLRKLECGDNQLTHIDVTCNHELVGLGCSFNQLTSVDLTESPNLECFLCSGNKMVSVDVSNCPRLRELGVVDCDLLELDVTNNPDLERLYCSGNKFKSLDLSNNTKMNSLYCEQRFFHSVNIIRPANNPDLGKGEIHTWSNYLCLIWWQMKDE